MISPWSPHVFHLWRRFKLAQLRSAGATDVVAVADEDEARRVHHNNSLETEETMAIFSAVDPSKDK